MYIKYNDKFEIYKDNEKYNLIDFFDVNRVINLAKKELEHNNISNELKIGKGVEESLEVMESLLIGNINEELEESYDVINTTINTLVALDQELIIHNIFNNEFKMIEQKEYFLKLIKETRKINSYQHLNTIQESKSGIKNIAELIESLVNMIKISIINILRILYENKNYIDFFQNEVNRKNNKWESKLI